MASDINLEAIAASLPESVTGADIGAVTSAAFTVALEKKLESLERNCLASLAADSTSNKYSELAQYVSMVDEKDLEVFVQQDDFKEAIRSFVPSVSAADHRKYEELREMYES